MSRRREVESHRHKLGEIRNIMNSMKLLANMELHKLTRRCSEQAKLVKGMEAIAYDFLSFYPATASEFAQTREIILLMGSERGFCGNFNETLVQRLNELLSSQSRESINIIALGHKLHALLEDNSREVKFINGANVAEESDTVLRQIVSLISDEQAQHPALVLTVLYHNEHGVIAQRLLPPFSGLDLSGVDFGHSPMLNVPVVEFYIELVEQYLFAILHQLIFSSLMVENSLRIQHLDGAVQHLDEKSDDLARRANALRQEEVIEEIEVILLNASSVPGVTK